MRGRLGSTRQKPEATFSSLHPLSASSMAAFGRAGLSSLSTTVSLPFFTSGSCSRRARYRDPRRPHQHERHSASIDCVRYFNGTATSFGAALHQGWIVETVHVLWRRKVRPGVETSLSFGFPNPDASFRQRGIARADLPVSVRR